MKTFFNHHIFLCLDAAESARNGIYQANPGKTTSFIFSSPIKYVDRGSKDVLAQQVKDSWNVLLLKATKKYFDPTNLTVITNDGKIHSFQLRYDSIIPIDIYYINDTTANFINAGFKDALMNDEIITTYCNALLNTNGFLHHVKKIKWQMQLKAEGIYIKDEVLFFKLRVQNFSSLDYDIQSLRFYIEDKKKMKRTAYQQLELHPLYISGNTSKVKEHGENVMVIALQKFTIPDAKNVVIEIAEVNGERNLIVRMSNKKLNQVRILADLK